jgi:WD40 repeat protein
MIYFWDPDNQQLLPMTIENRMNPNGDIMVFHPAESILAFAGVQIVSFWDTGTGQMSGEPIDGINSIIQTIALSPDGTIVATGTWDGSIRLWDYETRQPLGGPLVWHPGWITDLTFSPDGSILISSANSPALVTWSMVPDDWMEMACQKANRNLSIDEWNMYFPTEPYRKTCPDFP